MEIDLSNYYPEDLISDQPNSRQSFLYAGYDIYKDGENIFCSEEATIRMKIFLLNLERLVMIKAIRMIPIQGAFMPMTH